MCKKTQCRAIETRYELSEISLIDAVELTALVCDDFEITIVDDELKVRVKE